MRNENNISIVKLPRNKLSFIDNERAYRKQINYKIYRHNSNLSEQMRSVKCLFVRSNRNLFYSNQISFFLVSVQRNLYLIKAMVKIKIVFPSS